MKSIKLSEYFEIINPTYTYLKLTPHNAIRNYDSSKIAKTITTLYKKPMQQIVKQSKKIIFNTQPKITYMICAEKNNIDFYFIIPNTYLSLFKEKISDTWKTITIQEVDKVPFIDSNCTYSLTYEKEDALSLSTDRRANTLLSSLLNVAHVMQNDDTITILYNFIPCNTYSWYSDYNSTIEKIKNGYPVSRDKFTIEYAFKLIVVGVLEVLKFLIETIVDIFDGENKANISSHINQLSDASKLEISPATKQKRDKQILESEILVISHSSNKQQQYNNCIAVCEGFKTISEDNNLIYKKSKSVTDYNKLRLSNSYSKTSVDEVQNFIALPGRELLSEYKQIKKIDITENEIASDLKSGVMCIGTNVFKGISTKVYLSNDKEYKNLALCLIAPSRAGKTTLISNLANDGINNNECSIIFDFCGNCELSQDISKMFHKDKILNIDCSDFSNLQGLGYNEIQPISNSVFEIYRCAKTKTSQLMTLINSLNETDGDLRARMERYLESASVITFLSNGSISDVFSVLSNHKIRDKFIKLIPSSQKENTLEYVETLEELDDWSKETKGNKAEKIGTKSSLIQGILNRVNKLKQNTYMELMLKKDCSNNIDLVNEMQKAQLISIRMPEVMFSTEQEKDIYCTYWLTKIWGALQKRKWQLQDDTKRTKVNIFIDELYQVPQCQLFLKSKLSQIAKFSAKTIISCHYLNQIHLIRDELRSANTSYMLIAGCDEANYKELKSQISSQGYEIEDLLNLKRYHSLNVIKCDDGYSVFTTKLPNSLKKE